MHSTLSTADRADFEALLGALTDEELHRYGEIATDQRNIEYGLLWLEVLLWIAAVAMLAWGGWQFVVSGVTRPALLTAATALALAYWPWRKTRMRRLWQRHCEAVALELARRGTKAD